jgi:hypothetical protein
MLDTTERPDLIERYESACNASSLKVEERTAGPADLLIAAGWSPSRIGMGLIRLASEWDSAAKPRRMTPDQVSALADKLWAQDEADRAKRERENGELERLRSQINKLEPGTPERLDMLERIDLLEHLHDKGALPLPALPPQGKPETRAKAEAALWYRRELMLLAQSLKSRASVLDQLTQWAILRGIDPLVVGPALHHWLNAVCSVCDGHGFRRAEDAPALSAKRCHHCYGTGKVPHPEGSARVLAHIDYAVSVARGSLKKRLRNMR